LQARAARLRVEMGRDVLALAPPLAVADRLRAGIGWMARHPVWPAGLLALGWLVRGRTRRSQRRESLAGKARPRRSSWLARGVRLLAQLIGLWAARRWWVWRLVRPFVRAWRTGPAPARGSARR
jgi:hypothetical protein